MLIPTTLSKIASICDKKNVRFILGGVQLERDKEGPVAVAADGKRMIISRWEEPVDGPNVDLDTTPKKGFKTNIPAKLWADSMKLPQKRPVRRNRFKPKEVNMIAVDEANANRKVTLCAAAATMGCHMTVRAQEGRYPNWRSVIPDRKPEDETVIRINAKFLKEVLAAIPTDAEKDDEVELHVHRYDASAPVVLRASAHGVDTTAIIMPITNAR